MSVHERFAPRPAPKFTVTPGYLYSTWKGEFKVRKGNVRIREGSFTAGFIFDDPGIGQKCVSCSVDPGKLHNSCIWMKERNDALAKQIFLDYEHFQIEVLKEKIDRHKYKIKVLKSTKL